jgi:hypothetical protein
MEEEEGMVVEVKDENRRNEQRRRRGRRKRESRRKSVWRKMRRGRTRGREEDEGKGAFVLVEDEMGNRMS